MFYVIFNGNFYHFIYTNLVLQLWIIVIHIIRTPLLFQELSHPKGCWIGSFIQWVLNIIIVLAFPAMMVHIGVGLSLIIFASTMPLAIVAIIFLLVETKQMRFDQITMKINSNGNSDK